MKKITVLFLAYSFSISSIAQISVSGVVTNDSIPLESASVIIKKSTKGIATNSKGEFKIEAKKGDTLSVSYLGYETKEIVLNKVEVFKIQLKEDNKLDEVVIVAYVATKRTICGTCGGIICCLEMDNKSSFVDIIKETNKLFPNPSSNGIFQLKLTENYDNVEISIANMSGRIIQNSTYQKFKEKVTIDLSQFSTGIYIVNIIADGKRLESIKAIRS